MRYDFKNGYNYLFTVNLPDLSRYCQGNNQETTNYRTPPNSSRFFSSRKNTGSRKPDIPAIKRTKRKCQESYCPQ